MKHRVSKHWRVLLTLGFAAIGCGCSGDDQNESAGPDPARIEAAPDSTKSICEQVCITADEMRAKDCGTTEFANYSQCYAECVVRYLDYPDCQEDFDQSNECVIDALCRAATLCTGDIIMAAACMQVSQGGG